MGKTNFSTAETVSELKALILEFQSLQKQSKITADTFTKLATAIQGTGTASNKTEASFQKLETQLKNTTKSKKNAFTQVRRLKVETANLTAQNKKLELQLKKTASSSKKANSSMNGLLGSVKNLMAAFGIISGFQIFANMIKNAYSLVKTFDSLGFALTRITGSINDAADSSAFILDITTKFGTELVTTTNRWIKFMAAAKQSGLTMKQTEDIFRSMTKVSGVLGLQTDELRGIYLALEQMLSKGKITTEELRRQLGERLPGAMGIMAASMNVTISQLDKMMKRGEVLSAEVLPNFAKAVEIAYGIESVEKVETLVAAQNRLTTAWQHFVKTVITNSTLLQETYNQWAEILNNNAVAWGGNQAKIEVLTAEHHKHLINGLKKKFIDEANLRMGNVEYLDKIQKEKIRIQESYTNADLMLTGEAEIQRQKALDEEHRKIVKKELDFFELRDHLLQQYADKKLKSVKINYDIETKEAEDFNTKVEELRSKQGFFKTGNEFKQLAKDIFGTGNAFGKAYGILINSEEALDRARAKSNDELSSAIDMWNTIRKLAVVPEPITGGLEDDSSTKKLKDLKDLQNQINNEWLKNTIATNKEIIADEEAMFDERESLLEQNLNYQKAIIKNNTIDKLKEVEKMVEGEYVAMQDGITFEQFKASQIKLINDKANNEIKQLDRDYLNDKEKLILDHMKFLEKELVEKNIKNQTNYYKVLEQLRDKYDGEELKDKEAKLKLEFDEIGLFDQIDVFKKLIDKAKELGLPVEELEMKLAKIRAELAGLGKDGTSSIDEQKENFVELLDLAKEFNDAIGDLVTAQFDRKIEYINAEIEAETEKYDRLIELAENDEEQQASLRRQKEATLKKLEKERLREEQKKAKFEKAKALVDIAINTAVAITRLPADGGFLGLAAVPVMIALGALQAAAVLAQPIPQYKEGLTKAERDHIAMINDGSSQEYIERNGEILTTKTKNAIVGLKKGDTVHKDYDSMIKKSIMMNVLYNGAETNENDFDKLLVTVSQGLEKGFKKAKINSNIKINQNDNSYKEKMSRW